VLARPTPVRVYESTTGLNGKQSTWVFCVIAAFSISFRVTKMCDSFRSHGTTRLMRFALAECRQKLSTLQHEDFPNDSQYTSFNFLDDRTIGCKNDETRVHAPVMRMPLLVCTKRAMATALMDAHDDGLKF
jgi:hypothetical protein